MGEDAPLACACSNGDGRTDEVSMNSLVDLKWSVLCQFNILIEMGFNYLRIAPYSVMQLFEIGMISMR